MSIFLIIYERKTGKLLQITEFDESRRQEASAARLQLELDSLLSVRDREIVLLEAPSREALLETHGRYFEGVGALIDRMRKKAA